VWGAGGVVGGGGGGWGSGGGGCGGLGGGVCGKQKKKQNLPSYFLAKILALRYWPFSLAFF